MASYKGVFFGVLLMFMASAPLNAVSLPPETWAHADDFVFGYYPNGWRGRDADGSIIFCVQTSSYAFTLNASKATITATGKTALKNSEIAAQLSNGALASTLSSSSMTFEARVGNTIYDAVSGAPKPDDVIIRRLGKYLVNVEVRGIALKSLDGNTAPGLRATITLHCWPDRVNVQFQITADTPVDKVTTVLRYTANGGLGLTNTVPEAQTLNHAEFVTILSSAASILAANAASSVTATLAPADAVDATPESALRVSATGVAPYTGNLQVIEDAIAGWRQVVLGENNDIWTTERVRLDVENPGDHATTLHLAFSKRGGGFGITGMSPVLCDGDGLPLGVPVQISKNWHVSPAWFDGITVFEVPAKTKESFEFRLAYAQWGGVPAVAHAQLCLEGWGTHQLWDQMAIGSFGESICYDPDINLNRAMIDDMRPLMVWGMGETAQRKWSWTHNVGGADFLVLHQDDKRQFLSRQKTDYISQGPVLTTVRYSGETPDGALQSEIATHSWRSDDYVRGVYELHYKVTKPLAFLRLAFFQLAADRYNTNLFTTLSQGDLTGMKETWRPEMGGKKYTRERVALSGEKPWFALSGARKNPPPFLQENDQGAWANRGLIVHRWSAQLGGKDVPLPYYSVYGTMDGNLPSAVVELSPPPGLAQLEPGDFVDAQVEMLVLPQRAEDYYGPNDALRAALKEHPDDWYLVHREAVASNLHVTAQTGQVASQWPVVVRASNARAVFTVEGGAGYVPITIVGAPQHAPFQLEMKQGEATTIVDQASPIGNDWWQCRYNSAEKTFALSYSLPFDSPVQSTPIRTFAWSQDDAAKH